MSSEYFTLKIPLDDCGPSSGGKEQKKNKPRSGKVSEQTPMATEVLSSDEEERFASISGSRSSLASATKKRPLERVGAGESSDDSTKNAQKRRAHPKTAKKDAGPRGVDTDAPPQNKAVAATAAEVDELDEIYRDLEFWGWDGRGPSRPESPPGADSISAETLREKAMDNIRAISEVSRKSKKLKGTSQKALNEATRSLGEVVNALASRTTDDETRRLSREIEHLKGEMKALRQAYHADRSHSSKSAAEPPFSSVLSSVLQAEVIEELKRSLTISIGEMVNVRLASLASRLPPEPILRPPLAADRRKERNSSVELPAIYGPGVGAAPAAAGAAPKPASKTVQKPAPRAAPKPATESNPAPAVLPSTSRAQPQNITASVTNQSNPVEGEWTDAMSRKRRRKLATTVAAQTAAPNAEQAAKKKKKRKDRKKKKASLAPPRSAAIVLTLQPEAVEKGITYAQILGKARAEMQLKDFGVDGLRCKQAATGARILSIPGSANGDKADALATKLQEVLNGMVKVARPIKSVDMRISGLGLESL